MKTTALNRRSGATETGQAVINGALTTREIFANPWRRLMQDHEGEGGAGAWGERSGASESDRGTTEDCSGTRKGLLDDLERQRKAGDKTRVDCG